MPGNQREYKWTKIQTEAFLRDLFYVFEHPDEIHKYFLGSVVLINKGIKYEVIDGQQRLTTIIMFLAALKELYSDRSLKEGVQEFLTFLDNVGTERKEFSSN